MAPGGLRTWFYSLSQSRKGYLMEKEHVPAQKEVKGEPCEVAEGRRHQNPDASSLGQAAPPCPGKAAAGTVPAEVPSDGTAAKRARGRPSLNHSDREEGLSAAGTPSSDTNGRGLLRGLGEAWQPGQGTQGTHGDPMKAQRTAGVTAEESEVRVYVRTRQAHQPGTLGWEPEETPVPLMPLMPGGQVRGAREAALTDCTGDLTARGRMPFSLRWGGLSSCPQERSAGPEARAR